VQWHKRIAPHNRPRVKACCERCLRCFAPRNNLRAVEKPARIRAEVSVDEEDIATSSIPRPSLPPGMPPRDALSCARPRRYGQDGNGRYACDGSIQDVLQTSLSLHLR
jgi:hypothetical protein